MSVTMTQARFAALAVAGLAIAGAIGPAQAEIRFGDVITIHESVLVKDSPVAVWNRIGGYCAFADWVGPVTSCVYVKGDGQLGTVRKINVEGMGEIVELKSVQGPTSYTYEMTEGPLTKAKYRSTISTVPGPKAGTSEVHWQTTILRSEFPEDGGVGIAKALEGLYRASLNGLKQKM